MPPASLFPFSASDNMEAPRPSAVEDISLLSGRKSTILGDTCAYMSQVATYCLRVSTSSSTPTVLHRWNAHLEESGLLASSTAHRRRVWGVSNAQSARSRGRG